MSDAGALVMGGPSKAEAIEIIKRLTGITKKLNPHKRNPTSTRSRTRTSTSTRAHTSGNVTVTGGAGDGATTVRIAKRNPSRRRTIIYGRVIRIDAQKTQKHLCDASCKRHGHKYTHGFKPGAKMYGLPNGDIIITSR